MRLLTCALTFSLAVLLACTGQSSNHGQLKAWLQPNGRLKVLCTTAMINDIVQRIGDDHIDSLVLIRGELDPHSYQLVKGDDEKLSSADIIFSSGLGLEHGPSLARYLHNSDKAVPLGDKIAAQEPSLILMIDGQVDPHIWMDISLWARIIPIAVETLSQRDPEHAELYRANGQKLSQEMKETHQALHDQLQQIPEAKRYLVSSHDAFNYFARAYLAAPGERMKSWLERCMAPEGLAPDSQLGAMDIQKIIDHLLTFHIAVIFAESNVSRDSLRKIVSAGKEKGLDIVIAADALYGDAMGPPGSDGDSYLKMIQHDANVLVKYLGKGR
jgi:manganese/zinc/iron transport system substrate-binding protein